MFYKDAEDACVFQQRFVFGIQNFRRAKICDYSRHDVFTVLPTGLVFMPVFRPRFRLGIFGRLLNTTNPIVVVLTPVTIKDLSGCHCFYTYT